MLLIFGIAPIIPIFGGSISNTENLYAGIVLRLGATLLCIALLNRSNSAISFKPAIADLLHGLLAGIVLIATGNTLLLLLQALNPQHNQLLSSFASQKSNIAEISLMYLTVSAAAFSEEAFWRAYLPQRLSEMMFPLPVAHGISIALFSLGHLYQGTNAWMISLVFGAALAYMWHTYRKFWLNAISHLCFNAASLTFLFLS